VASCDFEHQDLCEYSNLPDNDINWSIADMSQIFNTGFEGPIADHTFGTSNGHYATFNTLNSQQDWSGRMDSEIIQGGLTPRCFKFYFSMFSAVPGNVGTLNVYVKSQLDQELVWSLTGSQGPKRGEWLEGRLAVARTGQYWISIEAVSRGRRGDIALDDLNLFESGLCAVVPSEADPNRVQTTTSGMSTTTAALSTFSWASESEFDCNFEEWPCGGWANDASNELDFNWMRNRGSNYLITGPQFDHTYGNATGYFIYVNVSVKF